MATPPLFDGAVTLTIANPLPIVAVAEVGAPGFVAGVTGELGEDGALVSKALFVAVTVNV